MAICVLPKHETRVRFPLPAQSRKNVFPMICVVREQTALLSAELKGGVCREFRATVSRGRDRIG